jgi:hypothetical protein
LSTKVRRTLVRVHIRRRDAGEAIDLFAAQSTGVVDRLADTVLELIDTVGMAGDAPLSLVPIAGRQVMKHLDQAAGPELLHHLFLRERVGEKILDPGEPDLSGRFEAVEEG